MLMQFKNFSLKYGVLGMLVLASCGGGSSESGGGADDEVTGTILGEGGEEVSSVDTMDPVNLRMSNLTANAQYTIQVSDPDGNLLSPEGGFVATADEDGEIPAATIVQDLSSVDDDGDGALGLVLYTNGIVPRQVAQAGEYEIVVTDEDGEEVLTTTFVATDGNKVYCSDSTDTARASFTPSENVFVTLDAGEDGDLEDGTYNCYARSDLNAELADQDTLSGTSVVVTVTEGTGSASLGTFASGQFDVVCDMDGDALYDQGEDLLSRPSRFRPCFTIQNENTGNDIIGQICSDRNGNYRDVFDPNADDVNIRDVFAWISPSEQSLVQHTIGVQKYVVDHQVTWSDGDALTDVDAAVEVDPVQGFCTNEAPWLVWPRQRLRAGCYDCVIDVNANGVYDKGTDFVDNIDSTGDDTVGGFCVADEECDTFISITSHSDGDTVDTTAITLEGTLEDEVSNAKVIVTSGSSSNTINVTPSGTDFTAVIPLFNGENVVTFVVTKEDGTVCSTTITLTQDAGTSGGENFRVQLTWDGDTDMDLHLVRPEGEYSNGGGGDDDCNYGNCKVGLDGIEGTNDSGENHTIDWGTLTDTTDDPFLDVDCIACGQGIENIWMNDINEDGVYKVYVDAFNGSETNVQVTIFIHGSTVGTVNCGSLDADTATDSCYVGDIDWEGGTDGNGNFTSVNTVSADF